MKILHISLKEQGKDYVSLRYFWDQESANYKEHTLPLAEILQLRDMAEADYYNRFRVYATTGQTLYNWLDKTDRLLANALKEPHPQGLIIAIATDKGLAHLPWELLHDGKEFLVEKKPSIIPVRWSSNGQPIKIGDSPQNRPLNLLFMATSPLGVEPELDYEDEEGKILEATRSKSTPVNLIVEESGCLTELAEVVAPYGSGYFDVFHLTGHATHKDDLPCFLTENEYGSQVDSHTKDIADAFKFSLPPLIFLSGCKTGYSSDGAINSMAEELLTMGATAVLGWGDRVKDTDATATASALYKHLAMGLTVTQAIASTYKTLINEKRSDWHKLRLYVADTLPQALVTPFHTEGREQLPKPSTKIEFWDDENRLRVVRREDFVGRRRQLQNCLRTLKTDDEKVGVLIHGMGGWGKSSIVSRLWDRLPRHEKILWWREIDEPKLINKLTKKLVTPEQQKIIPYLGDSRIPLYHRLVYLFRELANLKKKPFLLILDDFEWNLEPHQNRGRYILKPEVPQILEALVEAIQDTGFGHRIVITCRYDFDYSLLCFFYKQGLEPLRKAELTKKLNRLEHFSSSKLPKDVLARALVIADGNPRLLEFLNNEVLGSLDVEAKLTKLEKNPELWKDKIIWSDLYQLIDESLQQLLSYCLIYEISVPRQALEVVCESISDYKRQLSRAVELALIEVSPEPEESNRVYRVSRILPHIISSIRLPEAPEVYSLYRKAHEKLHQLWGKEENRSEEKWGEIFRLQFANRENPERFRQGFSQMLAVQYNSEADSAYESELRKVADYLVVSDLCKPLENYLKQKNWKEADEETAWVFYLVMVKEKYKDWEDLLENFPCETLKEINRLWLENSDNRFGISIQMEIYQSLGGTKEYNQKVWENFCDRVGWKEGENWLSYNELMNQETIKAREAPPSWASSPIPALIYIRAYGGAWDKEDGVGGEGLGRILLSRTQTCII